MLIFQHSKLQFRGKERKTSKKGEVEWSAVTVRY